MPSSASVPPGEPDSPDPLKTAPDQVTAVPGDGQVTLDWNSSGAESYNIYRGENAHGEGTVPLRTQINSTPLPDLHLVNGHTYYYQVTGVKGRQEGPRSAEIAATPQAAGPPPVTQMTAAQAIARAQTFCQAIGAPAGPGKAVFSTRPASLGQPDSYWQPRWRVQLGQTELEVVDATGVVTRYFVFGGTDRRPAGHALPRADALKRAAAVVHTTGLTEALGLPQAQEQQITEPPTRDAHLWAIVFPRQMQGHLVPRQQVTVLLQAETGAVKAVGVTFPTPPGIPSSR